MAEEENVFMGKKTFEQKLPTTQSSYQQKT